MHKAESLCILLCQKMEISRKIKTILAGAEQCQVVSGEGGGGTAYSHGDLGGGAVWPVDEGLW